MKQGVMVEIGPGVLSSSPAVRTARCRLLHRIHRRYNTVSENRQIGDLAFPFTRIANPDAVLDQVCEEADRLEKASGIRQADPQHLPYWAELWDSAAGVGQVMLESAIAIGGGADPEQPLKGRSVLDLGCGMGLTGCLAAAMGANVLFADLESAPLLFARLNSLPWRHNIRTRRLNWQVDRLAERFELILGADILYERSQWPYLDVFWRQHLAEGGTILLGEPGRQTGDDFLGWAPDHGWTLHRQDRKVPTRPTPVRVLRLTLAG